MHLSERISRLQPSPIRELLGLTRKPHIISFAGGLPASELLPRFDNRVLPTELAQYGCSQGEPELRAVIAQQAQRLGIDCQAEQVLITTGSQQGLDLLAKLLIDRGTALLLESPTYLTALLIFQLFGARCLDLPLTEQGPDLARCSQLLREHKPVAAYLIPSFQNPTGYCYNEAQREQMAQQLDEQDCILIEDEPYRDLAYSTCTRTPLVALVRRTSWAYLGSFSKTLAPGLRLGYLITSPDLCPHLQRLKQLADLHSNRFAQAHALSWLTGAEYPQHLENLRKHYRERRDHMARALHQHCQDLAEWRQPEGGLFFWLRLKYPMDTRPLLRQALERGVAYVPGEVFFSQPDQHLGYLRLNFSHATPEHMTTGIERLAHCLREAQTIASHHESGAPHVHAFR